MISREGKHEIAFRVCNSLFKITAVFNNNVRSQGHVCCRDHQQKVCIPEFIPKIYINP